jgi:[acyl-carrier-protein] S-malonyltransferase
VAGKKLKSELFKYAFSDPAFTVLSNVTASTYENKEQIIELLSEQIVKPVKWMPIMKVLEQNAVDMVIEFGPRVVLKNLVNSNTSIIKAFSYDKDEDITQLKEVLGGKEKQTKSYSILSRSMGIAVATKNNNWDKDEYQKGVVEPYEKVAQVQSELEQSGREADFDHMQLAVDMLKSVFRTKKTPIEEQVARFQQLFHDTNTGAYFKDFEI